jgi:hypothetical protein
MHKQGVNPKKEHQKWKNKRKKESRRDAFFPEQLKAVI